MTMKFISDKSSKKIIRLLMLVSISCTLLPLSSQGLSNEEGSANRQEEEYTFHGTLTKTEGAKTEGTPPKTEKPGKPVPEASKSDKRRRRDKSSAGSKTLDAAERIYTANEETKQQNAAKLGRLTPLVRLLFSTDAIYSKQVRWDLIWPPLSEAGFELQDIMQAAVQHQQSGNLDAFIRLLDRLEQENDSLADDVKKTSPKARFLLAIISQHAYYKAKKWPNPNRHFYKALSDRFSTNRIELREYQSLMNELAPYPVIPDERREKILGYFWQDSHQKFKPDLIANNLPELLINAFEISMDIALENHCNLDYRQHLGALVDAASGQCPQWGISNPEIKLVKLLLDHKRLQQNAPACDEEDEGDEESCIVIKDEFEEDESGEISVRVIDPETQLAQEMARLVSISPSRNAVAEAAWVYWGLNYLDYTAHSHQAAGPGLVQSQTQDTAGHCERYPSSSGCQQESRKGFMAEPHHSSQPAQPNNPKATDSQAGSGSFELTGRIMDALGRLVSGTKTDAEKVVEILEKRENLYPGKSFMPEFRDREVLAKKLDESEMFHEEREALVGHLNLPRRLAHVGPRVLLRDIWKRGISFTDFNKALIYIKEYHVSTWIINCILSERRLFDCK